MSFYIYRAPEAQKVQSFPITLFDGTGSMHKEYPRAINAYKIVFNDLGKKKLEYQWAKDLYPLEPFKQAGSGNITNTLTNMFQMLLSEKARIPKNITLVFISDGKEEFDLDKLLVFIDRMKQKYLIQFISVAVGDQFPNSISNTLRSMIHNHDPTCPPLFQITRSNTKSFQQIQSEFEHIFWEIRKRLLVSGEMILINLPVFYTITSKQPQNSVIANSLFLVEKGKTVIAENHQIQPTHNSADIYQMIINSVQQAFISQAQIKFQDAQHEFGQIQLISQDLLKQIHNSQKHDLTEEQKAEEIKVHATLNVAKQIAQGQLDLTNAKESDLTSLQDYLVNNVHKFAELATKLKSTTAKIVKGIKSIKGFANVVSNAQHLNELKKSHQKDHSENDEEVNQQTQQDQESEQDKMSSAQEIQSTEMISSNQDVLNQKDSQQNELEASPQLLEQKDQVEEPINIEESDNNNLKVQDDLKVEQIQDIQDLKEQVQDDQTNQFNDIKNEKNDNNEQSNNQKVIQDNNNQLQNQDPKIEQEVQVQVVQPEQDILLKVEKQEQLKSTQNDLVQNIEEQQDNINKEVASTQHVSFQQMANIIADVTKDDKDNEQQDQVEKQQQEEKEQEQEDKLGIQLDQNNEEVQELRNEDQQEEYQKVDQNLENQQEDISNNKEVAGDLKEIKNDLTEQEQIKDNNQQNQQIINSDEPEIIQSVKKDESDSNKQSDLLNTIHSYPVIEEEQTIYKMPVDNEESVLFKQPKIDESLSQSQNIILDEPSEYVKIESMVVINDEKEEELQKNEDKGEITEVQQLENNQQEQKEDQNMENKQQEEQNVENLLELQENIENIKDNKENLEKIEEKEQQIEDLENNDGQTNQNNDKFEEERKLGVENKQFEKEVVQQQDQEDQNKQNIDEEIIQQLEENQLQINKQIEYGEECPDQELRGQNTEVQENGPEVQEQTEDQTQQNKSNKKNYLWWLLLALVVGFSVRRFRKK